MAITGLVSQTLRFLYPLAPKITLKDEIYVPESHLVNCCLNTECTNMNIGWTLMSDQKRSLQHLVPQLSTNPNEIPCRKYLNTLCNTSVNQKLRLSLQRIWSYNSHLFQGYMILTLSLDVKPLVSKCIHLKGCQYSAICHWTWSYSLQFMNILACFVKIILISLNMPVSVLMSETVLISLSAIHFSFATLYALLWLDIMTFPGMGYFSVYFQLVYF